MTTALQLTALLLASVSAARSVMWLTSYAASTADTALAAASALGLTAAMYLLAAQHHCNQASRAVIAGLFILSMFATFDWAESGYRTVTTAATTQADINTELRNLLADAKSITATQASNAGALSSIGHNTRSDRITDDAARMIDTRRSLINDLQRNSAINADKTHTGTSADLLGNGRLVLWLLLATLLDAAGILCMRNARSNQSQQATEPADPLLEQIAGEIAEGIHGERPAVIRVAEQHNKTPDRIRQVFAQLIQRGELTRDGARYVRAGA